MTKTKILFLFKQRTSYGQTIGLINSARFVCNFLTDNGFEVAMESCIDANEIDRKVTEHNPKFVILEAIWATPDKLKEIICIPRHKNRKWIVRIHSKLSFLANEGSAFKNLKGYRDLNFNNLFIAPNVLELTRDFVSFGLNSAYLPNLYYPIKGYPVVKIRQVEDLHIGCFGAIRPMKNHLTQAVAAINFANQHNKQLYFHINGNRVEQKGDGVLSNLRSLFSANPKHSLVEEDWMSHSLFIQKIGEMDINMQVSLTETYNIVAADSIANGVPVVGSREISWLPNEVCSNPTYTNDIGVALTYVYNNPIISVWKSFRNLQISNAIAGYEWLKFFQNNKPG